MAAPHVAGIAGMMYSIDPSLTAESVKNYIISTAEKSGIGFSIPKKGTCYLVDAKAAVDKVLGSGGYEEKTNGIVLGKVIEKVQENEKNLKDVTVTVYENIDGEIKKADAINEEKTNEKGEYELVLPVGEYVLEFTKDKYVPHRENVTVIENLVKNIDDIQLHKGASITVRDEQTKAFLSDVKITVESSKGNNLTENKSEPITDENGEFIFDYATGDYTITLTKSGYEDKILKVKELNRVLYDEKTKQINEILLKPAEVIICGKVEKYDKNKDLLEPYSHFNVRVYIKSQSEKDDEVSENNLSFNTWTDSNGKYEISFNAFGDYVVVFTEEKQREIPINSSGTYPFNEVIELNIDENDDDDHNDNDGNNNNGNDDSSAGSDDWNDIGDTEITFDVDGDGDTSFTGEDGFTGDLSFGIWLRTSNGTDNYYVRIYTTTDTGEYQETLGSLGWGINTTTYHYWVNELKIATYKTDGTLINERTLDYFYKKVYVYLPKGYRPLGSTETTPLMKIESVRSPSLRNDGISYIIHTDGYYELTVNFIGSLGIRKEEWEKDETKTIAFYNNSKCIGVSYKSPFEGSEE